MLNFTDNFLFGDMRLQKRLRIAELDYDSLKSKNKLYEGVVYNTKKLPGLFLNLQ